MIHNYSDTDINLEEEEILDLIDEIDVEIRKYKKANNQGAVDVLIVERDRLKSLVN
jgi:hypothetical protein